MNNINHDLLFKKLLTTFFQEFMEAFFPEADRLIDYSYLEFLTQELIVDITTGEKKYIDILVK
ncbi:MAG: transposase, partial [Firmicutes bacterium]|nr:transposase [Bacillota bacterium]